MTIRDNTSSSSSNFSGEGAVGRPQEPPRLTLDESERLINWLATERERHVEGDTTWTELTELMDRVGARPASDIYHDAWPDGSLHREKWLLHVWHKVPMDILAQACILAKEDTGPHYLMFMEPPGYVPKADFTCWICGKPTPHTHAQVEVDAARQTLEVFHDNVWTHLCEAQAEAAIGRVPPAPAPHPQEDAVVKYRVEPDDDGDWHVLTFSNGVERKIFTRSPLVIVQPEAH